MDESADKGLVMRNLEPRSRGIRICVEGYDTSRPAEDVYPALRKHFSLPGERVHVFIPFAKDVKIGHINRFAFIYVMGEGAEEKVLKLSGSDMGGRTVVAKPYPNHETYLDHELAPIQASPSIMKPAEFRCSISRIAVEGYDTTLAASDVSFALREHFSSCGEIVHVYVPIDFKTRLLGRFAFIFVRGEGAEEKALGLGGTDIGGRIVVAKAYPFHETYLDLDHGLPLDVLNSHGCARRIAVEGYDTSLPAYNVILALTKHFASCGEVIRVHIPTDAESCLLNRFAYIFVRGEGAVEKALELSGTDMGGRKLVVTLNRYHRPSDFYPLEAAHIPCIRRICVEGYDTKLPADDVNFALREHFSSCGEMIHVYVPSDFESDFLNRFAFIYVRGEGAEEKPLGLSGTDMGGRIVVAKAYPFHETYLDPELAPIKASTRYLQHTMGVTGYDTSLSRHDVERMLRIHFFPCARLVFEIPPVHCGCLYSTAMVFIKGADAVDKALQLSGRNVCGMNIHVVDVSPPIRLLSPRFRSIG